MRLHKLLLAAPILLAPAMLVGQSANGLDPAELLKPLKDSWPTYSGDYTGKRYSALNQINQSTVQHLTLAWMTKVAPGPNRQGEAGPPSLWAAKVPAIFNVRGGTIKASVLEVDGVLYFTMPDNAWAVDARDGTELWHYFWKTKGGTHIGNRGLGHVAQDAVHGNAGRLSGRARCADRQGALAQADRRSGAGYFSTPAPVVVGNHVLVGTGNDIDAPGFVQSFDPETGDVQWKFYTVPMKKGDPGLESWGNLDAARHGGGAGLGSRRVTIRKPIFTFSAQAIRRRRSPPARAAAAIICSPAPLSP